MDKKTPGIHAGRLFTDIWAISFSDDCAGRACAGACSAVNAGISVDDVDITFRNGIDRTFRLTSATCYTSISNLMCHDVLLGISYALL